MSSSLSRIPTEKRTHLAAVLGLFAVLLVAVGSVAATGANTGLIKAFVVVAIVAALFLALIGWGLVTSVRQDLAEQQLDAAVEEVLAAAPNRGCDCGHEHDPDELHVVDDPCAHDGAGMECTHSCDACVLTALRPAPDRRQEAAISRPSPRPRPSPSRPQPTAP